MGYENLNLFSLKIITENADSANPLNPIFCFVKRSVEVGNQSSSRSVEDGVVPDFSMQSTSDIKKRESLLTAWQCWQSTRKCILEFIRS